ncbi:hypothetical protein MTO96_004206 [Rhipicephalus appendiculatus]
MTDDVQEGFFGAQVVKLFGTYEQAQEETSRKRLPVAPVEVSSSTADDSNEDTPDPPKAGKCYEQIEGVHSCWIRTPALMMTSCRHQKPHGSEKKISNTLHHPLSEHKMNLVQQQDAQMQHSKMMQKTWPL